MRIGTLVHQVRNAVSKRVRLAGARSCDDQERPRRAVPLAMQDGLMLRFIERFKTAGRHGPTITARARRTIVR